MVGVRWLQRGAVLITLLATVVLGIGPLGALAQGADDLAALRGQVSQLYSQGKYAEALPIAERYVALARQGHGEAHEEFAAAIGWMGDVVVAQGRYAEAEPLYQRALGIWEKALGPDHTYVGTSLNNLAGLYHAQGRDAEAERLYRRGLIILDEGTGTRPPRCRHGAEQPSRAVSHPTPLR